MSCVLTRSESTGIPDPTRLTTWPMARCRIPAARGASRCASALLLGQPDGPNRPDAALSTGPVEPLARGPLGGCGDCSLSWSWRAIAGISIAGWPGGGAALAKRKVVTAIDVLVGVGWLEARRVDEWRQGRVDYLERVTVANLGKISTAMRSFRGWAQARGLKPSETAYVARTRDRRPLRFSKSGDPEIERAYRTHWVAPELSERKRAGLAERQSRSAELVVVSPLGDFTCSVCGEEQGGWLIVEDGGRVCLACADLSHLLTSGIAREMARAEVRDEVARVLEVWRR
jgi:hypothetical protein